MPVKAYPLSEWLPDLADTGTVTVAKNVRAIANGYSPVGGFEAVTTALSVEFMGGGAFVGSTGVASLLGAGSTGLWRYSSGAWSSVYSTVASARWRFAQFGDNVVSSNGGQLASYDLVGQTASVIATSPSNCIDVVRVRDFVVALRDDDTVEWSEFNNSANWGTGENQADSQPLLGGGKGVALVGGENGLILQKNAVQRMTYTGGEVVFQFDTISEEIGCMAQGSVASVGQMVFWLSERGFMMSPDRQTIAPIGDEKFSRWFFKTYSRQAIDNIWAAVDPRNSVVMWLMPGNSAKIIAYNWMLQRATVIEGDFTGMFTGFTSNVSLEGVDVLYPTGLDDVPVSLDDASLNGGNPLLLLVDAFVFMGTLSGPNLAATVQVDNIEPTPGRRSRVRSLRMVTDATSAAITVDARMRAGDAEGIKTAGTMRSNGKCPIRSNGRYNNISAVIPAGERWSYLQAIECEFEAGDAR